MILAVCSPAADGAVKHRVFDRQVTKRGPKAGSLYSCTAARRGAPGRALPWISGRYWRPGRKPVIDGRVSWPQASFGVRSSATARGLEGNGLPVGATTGRFPIARTDNAYPFGARGQALNRLRVTGSLPRARWTPGRCVDLGQPIGIARNGVPILPPADVYGRDLVAREVHDHCGGTVDARGRYAYRAGAPCLVEGLSVRRASPLLGYARDGHPIYGQRGPGGRLVRNRDLDACHGRWETVRRGGRRVREYRYRLTGAFPYLLGCFRGSAARDWRFEPASAPAPSPPAPPAAPAVRMTTTPALFPAFDPEVFDYVTRCDGSTPVRVDVATEGPATASVDGATPRGGSFGADVGLSGGQGFNVATDVGGTQRTYHVRCLPAGFPGFTFSRPGTPSQAFYAVAPTPLFDTTTGWVALFDPHGVPVWFFRPPRSALDAKVLGDGTVAYGLRYPGSFGTDPNTRYEVRALDGTLVRTVTAVGGVIDTHDLQPLPAGHLLVISYQPRDHVDLSGMSPPGPSDATVMDAEIQELDAGGGLVWIWNSRDHLTLAESARWWASIRANPTTLPDGRTAYDMVHLNSIEPAGDSLVISARHLNAVYSISRATGDVEWKLGGTSRPESLTIVPASDPLASDRFDGQHDARLLADGTVTVHDNGTQAHRAPQALRYGLDLDARTATALEIVQDPDIDISACCGSARRLADGGWLLSWGNSPRVTELGLGGVRRFSLDFGSGILSYRADPVPAGRLSLQSLRDGMDAQYPRP